MNKSSAFKEGGEKGHFRHRPGGHRAGFWERECYQSSHCTRVFPPQAVGTRWDGPCFWCRPPRRPGRHRGARSQRLPSCSLTCALSPGKKLCLLATPSPLTSEPRTRHQVKRHYILPSSHLSPGPVPSQMLEGEQGMLSPHHWGFSGW